MCQNGAQSSRRLKKRSQLKLPPKTEVADKEKQPKTKNQKEVNPGAFTTPSFDMMQKLSQIKIYVPFLEMMKILEHRNNALALINGVPSFP